MNFKPKTEEELDMDGLIEKGTYSFMVIKAENYVSKNSGKESIKLSLQVWGPDNREYRIFDYITPNFAKKFKHFCRHCGIINKYETGNVDAFDCEGKSGWCTVDIQKQEGYEPKNTIVDYVECPEEKKNNGEPGPAIDDGCPF